MSLTAKQQLVADALRAVSGPLPCAAIADAIGRTSQSVRMTLRHMERDGIVHCEMIGGLEHFRLAQNLQPVTAGNEEEPHPVSSYNNGFDDFFRGHPLRAGCLVALALFVLAGGVVACNAIQVIEPGDVGVKTSMGTLNKKVYPNDWYWVWPWEEMTSCNVQEFSLDVSVDANQADAAVTKDKQALGYRLHVSCKFNRDHVYLLYEHFSRDPEAWKNTIVAPLLPHAFKTASSQRTLDEAIADRTQLSHDTKKLLSELLEQKLVAKYEDLKGAITISQVTVPNLDYSDEYQQVIEQTQRVQEQIREQRNQLVRYMVEQARSVVQAEAQQQAEIARATGAALSKIIEFEAELTRLANLVRLGVDPNQIYTWDRLAEIAAHWNGELPKFMNGGEGALPLRIPLDAATGEGREITEQNIELMLEGVRHRRAELEATLRELRDEQRRQREDLMTATEHPGQANDLLPDDLRDALGSGDSATQTGPNEDDKPDAPNKPEEGDEE